MFDSTAETDIEHIVARSEAHDSGLCAADAATRRGFSEDLLNLTLAAPALNRDEKGGYDAAEWIPDENACWFAQTVVDVRRKYGLTVDEREAEALDRLLATYSSTAISCALTSSGARIPALLRDAQCRLDPWRQPGRRHVPPELGSPRARDVQLEHGARSRR